jgi:hypothetical protein
MTAPHDLDRQLQAFLTDGPTELPDPSFDAVRDRMEATRQRVVIGPWRFPDMNKFVPIGLGAAAVVVALVLGTQFLGRPAPGGAGGAPSAEPSATPTPSPSVAPPSSPADGSLPEDPFVVTGADDPLQITVNIASSGWAPLREFDAVIKDDDGLDPPETVGVALIAWAWPAGTAFNVYGDPCQWLTTIPETPATTPDEIAAAFATQASTDATAPVDVTVGGFAGKAITLHVPMSYEVPNATREEEFADCDQDVFAFYGLDGEDAEHARNAQGPGQVDELWILDVNGSIVILDATYSPATPADLVDELRTLAESATFE